MQKFNDILNDFILTKDISKIKLSKATKIPTTNISSYCKGQSLPSVDNLILICDYFKCSIDYMLGLTEINQNINLKYNIKFSMKTFNNRLEIAKAEKSDYQLSKLTGIPNSVIYTWKTETRKPSIKTLIKLSDILTKSIDYLVGRKN